MQCSVCSSKAFENIESIVVTVFIVTLYRGSTLQMLPGSCFGCSVVDADTGPAPPVNNFLEEWEIGGGVLQKFHLGGVALTPARGRILFHSVFPPCPQGGDDHTPSPNSSPVEESGRGGPPPLGVKGSVSVSVSPSAR